VPASAQPVPVADLRRRIVEFVQRASIEITTHEEMLLPLVADKLAPGTTVYIAHTPRASLEDVVRVALQVESAGLRASPHVVARRCPSDRALRSALSELADGGIRQILAVAGDASSVAGPFPSSLHLLRSGALRASGIRHVGVAGHPEGHKAVGPTALWAALAEKQQFADSTGIAVHIVTQFGFNPRAVCAWDQHLRAHQISLPVHIGLSGPTSLPKLIRFAMQCGVGASLHALVSNMTAMSHATRVATSPEEMLTGLIDQGVGSHLTRFVQPHLFTFGGVAATVRWLHAVIGGAFELQSDGRIRVFQ